MSKNAIYDDDDGYATTTMSVWTDGKEASIGLQIADEEVHASFCIEGSPNVVRVLALLIEAMEEDICKRPV